MDERVPTPASSVHSLVTYDLDEERIEEQGNPFSDDEVDTAPPSLSASPKMKAPTSLPPKKAKITSGVSLVSYGYGDEDEVEVSSDVEMEDGEVGGSISSKEGSEASVHEMEEDQEVGDSASVNEGTEKMDIMTLQTAEIIESGQPATPSGIQTPENMVASSLSRSVLNMAVDDIELPPEPPGRCSIELQKKVVTTLEKAAKNPLYDLNRTIQDNKTFRNTSIYEKLIEFCSIDEKGTNFPPQTYDPYRWGAESMYDALNKAQNEAMKKREKERKEQHHKGVEFVSATKATSKTDADAKKRSKWDTVVPKATAAQQPDAAKTVIPSVGSLVKKKN